MFKIEGLDRLTRQFDEAQQALASLDGELGTATFDPQDPASIEHALVSCEAMVDEKLWPYGNNELVLSLGEQVKAQFRQQILDRAAQARIENEAS